MAASGGLVAPQTVVAVVEPGSVAAMVLVTAATRAAGFAVTGLVAVAVDMATAPVSQVVT